MHMNAFPESKETKEGDEPLISGVIDSLALICRC